MKIFIEILTQKVNYTINDVNNQSLELAKYYKITKYKKLVKWYLTSQLLKQNDIDTTIYKIMLKDRVIKDE